MGRIAGAVAELEQALRRARSRGAAARRRRRVVRLIDRAIGLCEARNLGGGAPPPPLASTVVRWLRAEAGEAAEPPASNQAALDELFQLQEDYLLAGPADDAS